MKQITRYELYSLKKELKQLEQQVSNQALDNYPDESQLNWIEKRTMQINSILNSEMKKAKFLERGLRLIQ